LTQRNQAADEAERSRGGGKAAEWALTESVAKAEVERSSTRKPTASNAAVTECRWTTQQQLQQQQQPATSKQQGWITSRVEEARKKKAWQQRPSGSQLAPT
jgi:hypothetical protein